VRRVGEENRKKVRKVRNKVKEGRQIRKARRLGRNKVKEG
jgi:hypothetical protein